MSSCPVCERTFEDSLSNEFVIHVNACLDSQEQQLIPRNFHVQDEARLHPLMRKQKEREQATNCVVCGKVKATAAHIKKCGKQNGVNTSQLIRLVGDSEPVANPNLENIVLKDTNLDQTRIVNDLFTDNENLPQPVQKVAPLNDSALLKSSINYSKLKILPVVHSSVIDQTPDCTVVLDKTANDSLKNGNQTKLKVVRKSRNKNNNNKLPDAFSQDVPLHSVKRRNTVKIKRNPLVKANLDDMIVQNFKDEYVCENELPRSWRLANLNYDSAFYTVDGFEEFCECFNFKKKMNGFEIGSENK